LPLRLPWETSKKIIQPQRGCVVFSEKDAPSRRNRIAVEDKFLSSPRVAEAATLGWRPLPPWGITENLSWSSEEILTFEARPLADEVEKTAYGKASLTALVLRQSRVQCGAVQREAFAPRPSLGQVNSAALYSPRSPNIFLKIQYYENHIRDYFFSVSDLHCCTRFCAEG
jgi:hypothetical protein